MTVVITPAPAPSYGLSQFGLTVTPDTNHRGLPQRIRKAQTVGRTYSFSATVADSRTGKEYRVGLWQSFAHGLETEVYGKGGRLIPEAHLLHIRQAVKTAYCHWFALKEVIVLGTGTRIRENRELLRSGVTLGGSELDSELESHLAPAEIPAAAYAEIDRLTRDAAHRATAPGVAIASPRYPTPTGLLCISAQWGESGLIIRTTLANRNVSRREAAEAIAPTLAPASAALPTTNQIAAPLTLNGFPVVSEFSHFNGYVSVMVKRENDPMPYVVATWWHGLGNTWSWGHYCETMAEAESEFKAAIARNDKRGNRAA